jgi:hypothetical protein
MSRATGGLNITAGPPAVHSPLQSTKLGENIAFTKNLDIDTFNFDVGSAVLAEQNFVANANADSTTLTTVEQSARANCHDFATLRLFASSVRQNDSASSGFFGVDRFNNNAIVKWVQSHCSITPL